MKTKFENRLAPGRSEFGVQLSRFVLVAMLGATVASSALSQPASGQGMGPGMGQGMGQGMGPGMGPGMGRGMNFNFNTNNTTGWKLMSTEERAAHSGKMRGAKTYDECKAIQEDHHKAMEARAKEKGQSLPAPRNNGCDRMKARGFFK